MNSAELQRIARAKALNKTKSGFSVALPEYYRQNYLSNITNAGADNRRLRELIACANHRLCILSRVLEILGPGKMQAIEDAMERFDAEDSLTRIDQESVVDAVSTFVQVLI